MVNRRFRGKRLVLIGSGSNDSVRHAKQIPQIAWEGVYSCPTTER